MWAFVDESYRLDPLVAEPSSYILGAALLEVQSIEEARQAVLGAGAHGRHKRHWFHQDARMRASSVQLVCELARAAVLTSVHSPSATRPERMRRICLEALLPALHGCGVDAIIFESRGTRDDRRDLDLATSAPGIGQTMEARITHLRGRDEPLLWLADAVCGCLRAELNGEMAFMSTLESRLEVIRLQVLPR